MKKTERRIRKGEKIEKMNDRLKFKVWDKKNKKFDSEGFYIDCDGDLFFDSWDDGLIRAGRNLTKELSKKLCKLCGIEPKTRYHVRIAGPVYKISKETVLKHSKIFRSPSIKVRKVTKDYPDFSNPENFVRLFDLTLPQKGIPTIAEFVTYEHLTITDSNDFLAKLIEMLKDDSYVTEIKQSIREAEWVYD